VGRLQVEIEGLNAERHVVTCNGRRLPLTATGRTGKYVCRRPLQGVFAALRPAPDDPGPRSADLSSVEITFTSIGGTSDMRITR
jgi:uncharacterized protein (DUF2126 family)